MSRLYKLLCVLGKMLLIVALGAIFFVTTSLMPRDGNYVVNGAILGDPAYREVRGIPFVFLKRSLADGECDIRDVQAGICDPKMGNEPHQLLTGYIVLDGLFWVGVSATIVTLAWRVPRVIAG